MTRIMIRKLSGNFKFKVVIEENRNSNTVTCATGENPFVVQGLLVSGNLRHATRVVTLSSVNGNFIAYSCLGYITASSG